MKNLNMYRIPLHYNIRDAVQKLDDGGIGFGVYCNEEGVVIGVITDGDFRRGVLTGIGLSDSVKKIVNSNFIFLNENYTNEEIVEMENPETFGHYSESSSDT